MRDWLRSAALPPNARDRSRVEAAGRIKHGSGTPRCVSAGQPSRRSEQQARMTRRPEPFQSPSVWRAGRAIPGAHVCEDKSMNGLIYLVGLIVVIMAVLSLFGLR